MLTALKKKLTDLWEWLKHTANLFIPGQQVITGASVGLLVGVALLWISFAIRLYLGLRDPWILLLNLIIVLMTVLVAYLSRGAIKLVNDIPERYKLALLIAVPLLIVSTGEWIIVAAIFLIATILGSTIIVLKKIPFRSLAFVHKLLVVLGVIVSAGGIITAGYLFSQKGFEVDDIENAALVDSVDVQHIDMPSPGSAGSYTVKKLTYGSGKDRHRVEFSENVDIRTDSVNGLVYIDNWEGFSGWWREKYWGFDSRSLPINGYVWYPNGNGPFPLVLIVHGNHGMQDFSDGGYEYLGELLASKGYIAVSVDQNFINGSWSDIPESLEDENDARAWLLLEHLRVWHTWNTIEDHLFFDKVDTTKIALVGHSRGGEAVGHAAFFNDLTHLPDDALTKLDYNYSIKSIVAIAPVDNQYEPANTLNEVNNVNYFVIHGSQDGDVTSYAGSKQFERVNFSDSAYHFKAGLYVYGANHGQFNSTWGDNDRSFYWTQFLNNQQLLSADDQQEIAKIYIGAFLDVTLKNQKEYIPLFIDWRTGKSWLPETIYLSQFEDSNFEPLATFDEDFDVSTSTISDGQINAKNLTVWREQEIDLKWQKKGSRGVFLGWKYPDSLEVFPDSIVAKYTLSGSLFSDRKKPALLFSVAESTESTNPKARGKWTRGLEQNSANKIETEKAESEDSNEEDSSENMENEAKEPLNFSIQLSDTSTNKVSFLLSEFSPLQRRIERVIDKTDFIFDNKESEMVFQTFYFPYDFFNELNPKFNTAAISSITFLFDKSLEGVIAIDNIGYTQSIEYPQPVD